MARPPSVFVSAGDRFGRGVVIDPDVTRKRRGAMLRCDCGNEYWSDLSALTAGRTQSCGCLRHEVHTAGQTGPGNSNFRHGLHWRSCPLYNTWLKMLSRCENPDDKNYPNYGGRGIKVCAAWHDLASFVRDIDHLLGPRPDGRTLDRIDNNGDYRPGNVRWATAQQQRANQRPYGTGALATTRRAATAE